MSSKPTIIDPAGLSKPKSTPAAPIEPLNNDIARIYTQVHPLVILSLYAYSFNSIVADPVPALLSILAPLAVLQIAYVAVCLPPTGETPKVKKVKPGEKKKHAPGVIESGVNGTIVVRGPLLSLEHHKRDSMFLDLHTDAFMYSPPFFPSSSPPSHPRPFSPVSSSSLARP